MHIAQLHVLIPMQSKPVGGQPQQHHTNKDKKIQIKQNKTKQTNKQTKKKG